MYCFDKFKIVVVGGGTAGWLTALYAKSKLPTAEVTVVESSEIGILGAGEGTTPFFIETLNEIDISASQIIKNTKGTIKNGIKFTNWNGDNKSYFHPFFNIPDFDGVGKDSVQYLAMHNISRNKSLDDLTLTSYGSRSNYLPMIKDDLQSVGGYALHFDANLLASYLKGIALSRDVKLIDTKIKDIVQDENGNITKLVGENNKKIALNFVFDCTGFHRLIIGKLLKAKWQSYEKSLPVDTALPFFIPIEENEDTPPYTEAIAMKYGWAWKIPVQGRYGCGYNYDSSMCTEEEARNEIKEVFGDVTIPRKFQFKAGCYKEQWKKNCIAIGLSSGFIEPLEATSIWMSCVALEALFKDTMKPGIYYKHEQSYKDFFNESMQTRTNEVRDFIQLHYITKRKDTPFWKNFKENNKIFDSVKNSLEIKHPPPYFKHIYKNFPSFNPIFVAYGCGQIDTKTFKSFFNQLLNTNPNLNKPGKETIEENYTELVKFLDQFLTDNCLTHKQLLKHELFKYEEEVKNDN